RAARFGTAHRRVPVMVVVEGAVAASCHCDPVLFYIRSASAPNLKGRWRRKPEEAPLCGRAAEDGAAEHGAAEHGTAEHGTARRRRGVLFPVREQARRRQGEERPAQAV